ncbi:MAG: hypothetical protein R3B38_00320 [Patescibacteria group bacterium]
MKHIVRVALWLLLAMLSIPLCTSVASAEEEGDGGDLLNFSLTITNKSDQLDYEKFWDLYRYPPTPPWLYVDQTIEQQDPMVVEVLSGLGLISDLFPDVYICSSYPQTTITRLPSLNEDLERADQMASWISMWDFSYDIEKVPTVEVRGCLLTFYFNGFSTVDNLAYSNNSCAIIFREDESGRPSGVYAKFHAVPDYEREHHDKGYLGTSTLWVTPGNYVIAYNQGFPFQEDPFLVRLEVN